MENAKRYNLAKYACYTTNLTMSVVGNLSPLLFVTFKQMYEISYTLLGLLVVLNFSTQLIIDLIFSFFPQCFNIKKTIKLMPLIAFVGMLIYAIMPYLLPQSAFLWIAIGTIVFSVSSGLCEVLASPLIAAIPSKNPDKEVSKLHSIYAWGVVGVVVLSTLYIFFCGSENWNLLALLWSIVPLFSFILFIKAELPQISVVKPTNNGKSIFNKGILLCVLCIFLGGATECTMAQWMSGFIENGLEIPKLFGDILGVALFAMFLGLGRTLYSKRGKNILNVMLAGMIGATACYFIAGVTQSQVLGLVACVITGFCASMLWPGTIIYVGENFRAAGVAVYALMAAGGDMGASVAPQIVGIISDKFTLTDTALYLAETLKISPEQVGMRAGMFFSAIFPILGIIVIATIKRRKNT